MKINRVNLSLLKMSFAVAISLFSNLSFAAVDVALRTSKVSNNHVTGIREVTGIVKQVDYVFPASRTGVKRPVVVVLVNKEIEHESILRDEVYFKDEDVAVGIALAGAIGKKIVVYSSGEFTLTGN